MNQETLKEWLAPVTHRPGWQIEAAGHVDGTDYITILAVGQDTNDPTKWFRTSPLFRVPKDIDTPTQLYNWILDVCIPGIDTHERLEWFKVDGQKWRDVHAPGMPAFATDFKQDYPYHVHDR
jgi:hypothetical protein